MDWEWDMGLLPKKTCLLLLAVLISAVLGMLTTGCGTEPASTRAIEERFMGMGYAQQMYRYAQDLLKQGRYQEAHAAFDSAEKSAHTQDLRQAARQRRMWLEEFIRARQEGREPPAEPIFRGEKGRVAPVPVLPPPPSPAPPGSGSSEPSPVIPIVEKPLAPVR
jgi:hypothetical protein